MSSSSTSSSAWQDFRQGLVTPSLTAVSTALVLLAVVFGLVFGFGQGFVASERSGYLARNGKDHHLFVTTDIAQIGATRDDDRPLVAIIGASVTLSSLGPQQAIAAAIAARTGVESDVRVLATSRQSILEHRAIVAAISGERPVHILIGIGPSRFTRSRDEIAQNIQHTELGFRSDVVNEEAALLGLPPADLTGIYAYDNRKFLLSRQRALLGNLARGRPRQRNMGEYLDRQLNDADFERHSGLVQARFENFEQTFEPNLAMLERLSDHVAALPNAHLYLMEHPINPRFVDSYLGAEFYADYQTRLGTWAAEKDIPYWSLAKEGAVTGDEYYDWAHIRSAAAQARMRKVVAARLEMPQ